MRPSPLIPLLSVASLAAALLVTGCSQHRTPSESDLFNQQAALPASVPIPVLEGRVIASSVDRQQHTMSILTGNDIAVASARASTRLVLPRRLRPHPRHLEPARRSALVRRPHSCHAQDRRGGLRHPRRGWPTHRHLSALRRQPASSHRPSRRHPGGRTAGRYPRPARLRHALIARSHPQGPGNPPSIFRPLTLRRCSPTST